MSSACTCISSRRPLGRRGVLYSRWPCLPSTLSGRAPLSQHEDRCLPKSPRGGRLTEGHEKLKLLGVKRLIIMDFCQPREWWQLSIDVTFMRISAFSLEIWFLHKVDKGLSTQPSPAEIGQHSCSTKKWRKLKYFLLSFKYSFVWDHNIKLIMYHW